MDQPLLGLTAGDYRLVVNPACGGAIARFDWRGQPLLRQQVGPSVLDAAAFPLVPFCNRIAHGRFTTPAGAVKLPPNMPGSDHPHPLHGFGWLASWTVTSHDWSRATIAHHHEAGDWPWTYRAEQHFALTQDGATFTLSVINLSDEPMPCGLGFHPYFPQDSSASYHGLHRCEWTTADDGLPVSLNCAAQPIDWWGNQPVAARAVDTCYADRHGPLTLTWPSRALQLTLEPSANLPCTTVFSPPGEHFFCVEPVSHPTDAINRRPEAIRWLASGETMQVELAFRASRLCSADRP